MTMQDRLALLEDGDRVLELPAVLRTSRTAAGISQGEIADELGLTRTAVGDWERGKYVPARGFILAWSLLTGTRLSALLPAWERAFAARAATDGRRVPGAGIGARGKTLPAQCKSDWLTLFPDDDEVTIDLRETGQEHHEGSTASCRYGEWGVQERGDHAHVGGAVHRREDDDGGVDYRDRNKLCERPSQVRDLDFEAA